MNQSINTDSKNSKEPQQKYRLGTVSIKILGLKPVLQAPNLALSFYHGSKHTVSISGQKLAEVMFYWSKFSGVLKLIKKAKTMILS